MLINIVSTLCDHESRYSIKEINSNYENKEEAL